MKQQFTLKVADRAQTGRSASRRLRKVNRIPAILYGKGQEPEKLSVEVPEFTRLLKSLSGRAVLLALEREGKAEKALSVVKEIQRDPITDIYLHLDLQEVNAKEKMEMRVPVQVVGEAYGVKTQAGVLERSSFALRIRCFPKDLPSVIEVDVTELKLGETLHVNEMKPIEGVEFLDQGNQPVVSCVDPVGEIAAATPTAAAAAAAPGAAPAAGAAAAPAAAAGAKPAAGAAAKPAAGAAAKPAAPAKK